MFKIDEKDYSLRPATEDDLPKVLEIEAKCYPHPAQPWSKESMGAELHKPFAKFLVLTDDDTDTEIAAYIVFWQLFDETHILNVAVDPQWRGLGLGTKLVRHAIKEAHRKEMKKVYLEVRKSNQAAVDLYQKVGFFVDHIVPKFYENGEDAYFMMLFLDQSNKF